MDLSEIKKLLEDQGNAWEQFQSTTKKDVARLKATMHADFADPRVIALTERLICADRAVQAISRTHAQEEIVPDKLIKDTPIKDRPIVKKERMRFTLAASYIGGNIHAKCVPRIE